MKKTTHRTRIIFLALCALGLVCSSSLVYGAVAVNTETVPGHEMTVPVTQNGHDVALHEVAGEHGDAAAVHGEAAGHEEVHKTLSGDNIKNFIFRILNFAILIYLLVRFGAKKVGDGLSERRQAIKDEIENLEERKAVAENSYRELAAKLAMVERDIDGIVAKAVAQAEVEKAKIIEKAEQTAEDIKRQAEMAIQKELMDARRTLKDEVADQAAVLAEELIVRNLTEDDQVKIVEEYLDKVGAVQ